MRITGYILFLLTIISCSSPGTKNNQDDSSAGISLKYATGFRILNGKDPVIQVLRPFKDSEQVFTYILQSDPDSPEIRSRDTISIKVPVKRVVCISTTHLAFLDLIGRSESLVGFTGTKYISSPQIRSMVERGDVIEVGNTDILNVESILELNPDLVIGYSLSGDISLYQRLIDAGVPVVLNSEYLEETPLGRAEWIRFMAAFFEADSEADSVFRSVEKNYLEVQKKAGSTGNNPAVLSAIMYSDVWYMPGGKSWAGKYFRDASANYLWDGNDESGSIPLSFEAVYSVAHNADYWIGASSFESLAELSSQDSRYRSFKAFEQGNVYTYNARVNESGGNDFFEMGTARPDLVLSDLVKILHPGLLPDHELYFYRKLDP